MTMETKVVCDDFMCEIHHDPHSLQDQKGHEGNWNPSQLGLGRLLICYGTTHSTDNLESSISPNENVCH